MNKYKRVKTVLWVILFANFLVAIIKIAVGLSCDSQGVIADGIHSFADGASNIIGLIGIQLASKPCDAKHQYGHGKYEILASLSIGLMLAVMSAQIMSRALISFRNDHTIDIDITEGILMALTVIVNSTVAILENRYGKKMNSMILITDSLHTRGDILISCAVLIGIIGIKSGLPVWIDAVMSIAVSVAILISALKIIKRCTDVLVDSAVVNCNEVRELLMTVPGVYDIHRVRSRGEHSHIFIDFHVIISPDADSVYIHELSHRMETVLQEHFGPDTEANIHLEPDDGFHGR